MLIASVILIVLIIVLFAFNARVFFYARSGRYEIDRRLDAVSRTRR